MVSSRAGGSLGLQEPHGQWGHGVPASPPCTQHLWFTRSSPVFSHLGLTTTHEISDDCPHSPALQGERSKPRRSSGPREVGRRLAEPTPVKR